ncbi:unnamed protein product [Brassicogethes aeneus]|uniref:Aminopeptidase n=1 Tax=Brassicogethes aeneus TaxID=1431903 RepID=A0A9P0FEH9_BRAAE|nr:unnamed protein product [Brassicogethes aeneus]
MGRGGVGFHSSRAEFLTDDALNNDLKYSRNGGCFVTTKKAIAFVVFAVVSLAIVIMLMYYYGPNRKLEELQTESNDIEKLINKTIQEKLPEEEIRLPKTIYPLDYRLWIHPILDEQTENNFTFTGQVQVLVNCTRKTNKIILNIDDLNITESDIAVYTTKIVTYNSEEYKVMNDDLHRLRRDTGELVEKSVVENEDKIPNSETMHTTSENPEIETENATIENMTETTTEEITTTTEVVVQRERINLTIQDIVKDEENFKLTIIMMYLLEPGHTYTVDIKFSGDILNNLKGLYKTSYTDLEGNTRWLATTHFQSVFARRVFPCFDEPYFKSTFEISIAHRTNMTALSNMPLRTMEPKNDTQLGWTWSHFMKSPPMSTYIVGFTISDFESNGNVSKDFGPIIKVWAPKDDLVKTKYALEVAEEILPFLEKYFGIKYPLPKLDLLAIPNFGKGAMENWGLISFRKSALLFDPDSRSIKTKSFIFNKIAHELAHQWFGNLVTLEWWSELWLNEGLATFISEVVLTNLRPRWQLYSSLQLRDTYKTLYFDSLKSTHSIQTSIKSTAEIEQIFEPRIYQKGCSIMRMLNHTLTKDVFTKGLQDFIRKYAYSSASQDDLWEIFTITARNESIIPENVTVKDLMDSWTKQSGFPLVTVTRNYSSEIAKLNQTKMAEDNIPSESLWFIPVTYITSDEDNVTKSIWVENVREIDLNLTSSDNNSWVLLNIDETGFYRVNYDLYNWKLLKNQLLRNPQRIPVYNRGQLIDDAFHLSNMGSLNYTIAFELTKYLNIKEQNYIPWYSALRSMEELRIIITNYEYTGLYDNYLLKLTGPMYEELGPKDRPYDTQNEKLLRLHLVQSVCKLGYPRCVNWARAQYDNWMSLRSPDELNPIPVDYRFITQCVAIKHGGITEWDFLWNRTLSAAIEPVDLAKAYLSLGCTNDPWLINRYLEYCISGNITLENVPFVWQSINHPVGVRTGFQFLRLNWERIYNTFEDVFPVFSSIFHDFLSQLSTEIDLEDLTTFYKLHQQDLSTVSTILQGTVDQIKVRINWKTKHLDSVIEWLKYQKI